VEAALALQRAGAQEHLPEFMEATCIWHAMVIANNDFRMEPEFQCCWMLKRRERGPARGLHVRIGNSFWQPPYLLQIQ
jgi:hypothetical protein